MAEIDVKFGGRTMQKVVLTGDTRITIGRTAENTIVLDNAGVSRNHATLDYAGGRLHLSDNGSLNGTYLNGSRVTNADLKDGDVIDIGKYSLQYLGHEENKVPGEALNGTMFLDTRRQRELTGSNAPQPELSPAAAQAAPAHLIREDSRSLQEVPLNAAVIVLGKGASADVAVRGFFVAPYQAQIVMDHGEHYLMNVGKRKKTYLNGNPVMARVKLRPEDLIKVGATVFRYRKG